MTDTFKKQLRKIDLAQWFLVLKKSRISLLSSALITTAFPVIPQAQDVLRALAEPGATCQLAMFELFLIIWATAVWYGARFILDQNFEAMRDPKAAEKKTRALWGESFIPRFLASAGIAGLGIAMVLSVRQIVISDNMRYHLVFVLGIANILLGIFFYVLFKFRIWSLEKINRFVQENAPNTWFARNVKYEKMEFKNRSFKALPGYLKVIIYCSLIVSVLVWAFLVFNLQSVAPKLGAAAILFLSFIFITIFGTGFVWIGERKGWPIITMLIVVAGIFGTWNDNHVVRKEKEIYSTSKQLTAGRLYKSWLEAMDREYGTSRPHPLFIIASSGGGIKAAYWTATVLSSLQDSNDSFARHTIIISPVSGGALGSLTFVNLVAHGKKDDQSYEKMSRLLLSQDFLSPTLGSLFFHDLPARFSPFPHLLPDRAKALEVAWERAWRSKLYQEYVGENAHQTKLDAQFSTLLPKELDHSIPTLLINGTSVEEGGRILTTHLDLSDDFPDCDSLFAIRPNDIKMSTAAMMSARFTYVSPAGTLSDHAHVVDGGYYENSGSVTAIDFFELIQQDVLKDIEKNRVLPIFIQIDNDYWTEPAVPLKFFPELLSPVAALLKAREAHADSASVRAQIIFDKGINAKSRYIHYNFCAPEDVKAPLGWYLSLAAQTELQRQLHGEVICNANVTDNTNRQNSEQIHKVLEPFNKKTEAARSQRSHVRGRTP